MTTQLDEQQSAAKRLLLRRLVQCYSLAIMTFIDRRDGRTRVQPFNVLAPYATTYRDEFTMPYRGIMIHKDQPMTLATLAGIITRNPLPIQAHGTLVYAADPAGGYVAYAATLTDAKQNALTYCRNVGCNVTVLVRHSQPIDTRDNLTGVMWS